ncbi:Protein ABHD8 [Trichoplax sp. H2]|nr:Protein ABHD8 [Trichoplax sp. H2]|eukprot:RDD45186.1 Protein ABHD8 [Trichoplax sp. H2]
MPKKNKVKHVVLPRRYTFDIRRIQVRLGRYLNIAIYKPIKRRNSQTATNPADENYLNTIDDTSTSENADPPVVFFIHGVGGSHLVWQSQLEHFSSHGYIAIAPDLLGHGNSDTPRGKNKYTFEEMSKDVLSIFDRYCHRKNNFLVGHSYGSSFCALTARERQNRVLKIVLISCGLPSPLQPHPGCIFSSPMLLLKCVFPLVSKHFIRNAYAKHNTVKVKKRGFLVRPYALKHTMLGQIWEEGDESYYHELHLPVLIIHGEQDKLVDTEEDLKLQEVIYGSDIEIVEEAGHNVMMEFPTKIDRVIMGFLRRDFSHLFGADVWESMNRVQARSFRYGNADAIKEED